MNILDPVSSIMTPNPITVGMNDSLAIIAKLFSNHKIHHLPVVEGDELVGMISKSDFLFFKRGFSENESDRALEEVRMNNYTSKDIMTKRLAKLEPGDKINVALEVFKENMFHGLPVVDNKKIIGIVTTYDIIKGLAEVPHEVM
ncbi:MAG: CBS domain-containing protein [Saprospiraceae bacterium]|nr:CBS domain-containing protein [Saprospiraceae bacterium]